MLVIKLNEFAGVAPVIDPRRLADKFATVARNAGFNTGALAGVPVCTVASSEFSGIPAATKSLLRPAHDAARIALTNVTFGEPFASMMAPFDKWGRVYFTTSTGPRYTVRDLYDPTVLAVDPVSYVLGIPTPKIQPTVNTPNVTPQDGVTPDLIKVAYIYTYVDSYGHEGAPSKASTLVDLPTNLKFSTLITFTDESLPQINVDNAKKRIYRAAFDGASQTWMFLADVPLASSTFEDTIALGSEGEELISQDWVPPPEGLKSMTSMSSNFAVGFVDNLVCYSEVRLPHAWPEAYRFTLKYQIVGLKPTQNGLLIATTGKPYWAFGADPASAVPVELDANYPCLSADSLVDMGGYVMYASQDGLVAVSGQDIKLVSEQYIDRLVWLRDFNPAQIKAFTHEGLYIFGTDSSWWALDPTGSDGLTELTSLAVSPVGLRQAYYDARRDTTVLLNTSGQAFDIVSQRGGAFYWKSRKFSGAPTNLGVVQVISDVYPVAVEVISDGVTNGYSVLNNTPVRLRSGFRAREWQVSVTGSGAITEINLAISPQELSNG